MAIPSINKFSAFYFELLDHFARGGTELTVQFDTPSIANTRIRTWNYFVKALEVQSRSVESPDEITYWTGKLAVAEQIGTKKVRDPSAVMWYLRDTSEPEVRAMEALRAAIEQASKLP